MNRYRKLPVEVDAVCVRSGNYLDWEPLLSHVAPWRVTAADYAGSGRIVVGTIATLEGSMSVLMGDYIIRGVEGELYPCAPHIFAQTYEIVKE